MKLTLTLLCLFWTFVSASINKNSQLFEDCKSVQNIPFAYKFNVWILVPFGKKYKFSYPRVKPAIERALNDSWAEIAQIENWNISSLFNKSAISVVYEDTKCNADWAPSLASDNHDISILAQCNATGNSTLDIDVFIGLSCDYVSGRVAALANHWNWPLIYPGTRAVGYDIKNGTDCCSTMVRPGVTAGSFGSFMISLFKRFDWNTSVIVYTFTNSHGAYLSDDTNSDCATILKGLTNAFMAEGWENDGGDYEIITRSTDAFLEEAEEPILDEFRTLARVSVWCVGRRTMRKIMQAAEKRNMTNGDYVFIYMDLYNANTSYIWTDDDDHLQYDTSSGYDSTSFTDPHTEEYLRALTVVTLHTPTNQEFKQFSDSVKEELITTSDGEVTEDDEFINPFIGYYYDAMRLFIYGLLKTFCVGSSDFDNGEAFAQRLFGIEFESLGRNVTISKTGDQRMDYSVMDMNNKSKRFEVVLTYHGITETFEEVGQIDWPGSVVPLNVPLCGYENENCQEVIKPDNTVYYILVACAVALILACVIMTMLYRNMMREKRMRKMMWKVKWEDIDWTRRRRFSLGESKDSSQSLSSSNGGHHYLSSRQVFTKVGLYKGNVVAVKELKRRKVSLNRAMLVELEEIYAMDHTHICRFVGAVDESPHVSILTEYCSRGSLQDLLEDEAEYEMDDVFKNSLISDITKGMAYLHKSFFQFHGNLKSSNCLIDSRFVVKLTDFGLAKFREGTRTDSITGFKYYENKLWTAPEHLRSQDTKGSQKGDVYSYGIVVQEIIYRKGVFYRNDAMVPQEILHNVTSTSFGAIPFRPTLSDNDDVIIDSRLRKLVRRCWAENPLERPGFSEIQHDIKKIHRETNLVDSLLERLENYSQHLEEKVDERTEQYKAEKERADSLLYQMLPKGVADQLKRGNNVLPKAFDSVTIFFSDIVGFTAISHGSQPMQVVNMLNDLYTMFDQILDKFDVYKVETIGDAYMVVSGLPDRNGDQHAREIARMSLRLLDSVANEFKIKHMPETQLKLRVGIHTGPVVAGVVGLKMPRYCLFGDTVNTASRMESNGKPLSIHISPKTKVVLDKFETFILEEREEEVFLKGLGKWKTYWLRGENPSPEASSIGSLEIEQSSAHGDKAGKAHGNIVTFERETAKRNHSFLQQRNHGDVMKVPNSIMKDHRTPPSFRKLSRKSSHGKRRRSGVIGVSETVKLSGTIIATPNQKRKEMTGNHSTETDTHEPSVHIRPSSSTRRVQFNNSAEMKYQGTSQNDGQEARKSGRDSGIGLGFDNAACLEEMSTEENDFL